MAQKEIVVNLRIADQGVRETFNRVNAALVNLRQELTDNNKALRENAKAQKDVTAAQRAGELSTEQAAVASQRLSESRKVLLQTNAGLKSAEAGLSAQHRELKNEVGGLTEAHLRFRDKMADATLEAIKQSGILGQLGARANFLETQIEELGQEYREGKVSAEQYAQGNDKLQKELQEVGAQTASLNTKLDKLQQEFLQGKITAEQFREATKGLNTSIEGVGGAVNKGVADLKSYALGFVGVVAVAQGVISVLKGAGETVANFQKANANLAAILGTTRDKITSLTDSAVKIGPAFARAPEEVTALQTELAKLGFTVPEILAAQEAVILLANATGEGLGKSAEVAAATLNAFNLTAEDTGRVVDVIAQAANSTSLDLEKFSVAMATVGPTAVQAGLSIEETTALVGVLADRGIDASVVGTSLRSIFIDLAKTGGTLEGALAEINGSTNKTNTAFQLFGERAAGAAVVLAEVQSETQGVTDALNNAGGAAERVANEQLTTLSAKLATVDASWKAFVLSVDRGDGVIGRVIGASLTGLATILGEIAAEGDKLGRRGAEKGTIVSLRKDLEAGREEINKYISAQNQLASSDANDKLVDKAAAQVRILLNGRGKTLEGLIQIEENFAKKVEEARARVAAANETGSYTERVRAEQQLGVVLFQRAAVVEAFNAKLEEKKQAEITAAKATADGAASEVEATKATTGSTTAKAKDTEATRAQADAERDRLALLAELTTAEQDRGIQQLAPQAQEEAKATVKRDDRVARAAGDATLLLKIEADYQAELQIIRDKFAAEYLATLQDADAAALALKAGTLEGDSAILADKFARDYEALDGNLIAQLDRQTQYQEELAELTSGYNEQTVADQLELNRQIEEADTALLLAKIGAIDAIGTAFVTLSQQGSVAAKIGLALQKAANIAQIIITAQASIAASQAQANAVPAILPPGIPNPAYPAAQAISAADIVRTKVVAASSIAVIAAQAIKGFEVGGYTAPGHKKKPAGIVHAGEWVAPQWQVNDPKYAGLIEYLERERARKGSGGDMWDGWASGGLVRGTALVNAAAPREPSSGTLLALEQLAESRAQDFAPVVSVSEINRVQQRVTVLEQLSKG